MRGAEHNLQTHCVRWFRYEYPELQKVFFAVPNGGHRHPKVAVAMKREGQLAGVSDLVLLVPRNHWHGLLVEMKTEKGRQSKEQKAFEQAVRSHGYAYHIARSFDQFRQIVIHYLR